MNKTRVHELKRHQLPSITVTQTLEAQGKVLFNGKPAKAPDQKLCDKNGDVCQEQSGRRRPKGPESRAAHIITICQHSSVMLKVVAATWFFNSDSMRESQCENVGRGKSRGMAGKATESWPTDPIKCRAS